MIERVVRNDEVVGLIPICSTILRPCGAREKDALRSFSVGGPRFTMSGRALDGTASQDVYGSASLPSEPLTKITLPRR